ncbi:MAG: ClcB-like voltage-gated chloride channel protein [Janthinobacterium lividum]
MAPAPKPPLLTRLLQFRLRAQRRLRLTESHTMLLWAVLAGFAGACATIAFRELIRASERLIASGLGAQWDGASLVELARHLPWYVRLVLPALGGVVAGACLLWGKRFASGATSDYMEAVAIGDGSIPIRQNLTRCLSSLFTIASGGSIGREGSMVQLAAMSASALGRVVHFDPARLRLMVACGAAAGITAAYNAPIAGAFFVTEIVLGAIVMESFGPIVVASVIANMTMRLLPGYRPTYEMPSFPEVFGPEIIVFVGLGIVAGLLAPQFLRLLGFSRRRFNQLGWPLPWRLGVGGLAVGLISLLVPQVWGNGYSVVNGLLHQPATWSFVATLLVCKVVATALTTGSGAVGGIFTPTLFVGASIGWLVGAVAHSAWPASTSMPFAYAIVGMGAFLAAATSAPLMAILMIFEMTLSYEVMLPLMLACVVAYFVSRTLEDTSMYEVTIKRNQETKARMRLRGTRMRDLVKPAETVLPVDAPLETLSRMFLRFPVKYVYIVDDGGRYQGVVALQDIASSLMHEPVTDETALVAAARGTAPAPADSDGSTAPHCAADWLRRDYLEVVTPDMSLSEALQRFLVHQGERLPVIASQADPVLLGVVYKTSLLDAYVKLDKHD